MTREDEKQYKSENSIISKFRLRGGNECTELQTVLKYIQISITPALSQAVKLNQIPKKRSHFSNRMKNSFRSLKRGFKMGGGGEGGNGTYVE